MPNKLFDDLLKVIEGALVYTGATAISLEIDFELPRGYVAKIRKIILRVDRIMGDIESVVVDKLIRYLIALLLDPDDTTTTTLTSNTVEHDVIADHEVEVLISAGTAEAIIWITPYSIILDFDKMGVDVITARNMRLNIDAEGTNAADATGAFGVAQIYYTLEKIKDEDILEILNIL